MEIESCCMDKLLLHNWALWLKIELAMVAFLMPRGGACVQLSVKLNKPCPWLHVRSKSSCLRNAKYMCL